MGNGRSPMWFWPGPRRSTPRTLHALALAVVIVQAGSGCQRLPLRVFESTPEDNSRTTTKVEPAADSDSAPAGLPSLPSRPIEEGSHEPGAIAPAEKEAPAGPTPLLDAALSRASAIEPAPDESTTKTASALPALIPASPDGDPIELPDLASKPIVPITPSEPKSKPPAPTPEPKPEPKAEANVQEPKKIDPEKTVSERPREPWRDGLSELQAVARLRAGKPGDDAEQWRIRSYILDRLADRPRDGEPQPAWSHVIAALALAAGPETPEPTVLAPKIHEAVEALESLAPLTIVDLQLCRKIVAFGSREPLDASALRAGQPVLVYCEMTGLSYEPGDDAFHSRLSASAEIVPAAGGAPVWSEALGTADDSCRQRRRDYYVNYRLVLPASLEPGQYQFRITQKDAQSEQAASATLNLKIVP